jgi:hypothetical protein
VPRLTLGSVAGFSTSLSSPNLGQFLVASFAGAVVWTQKTTLTILASQAAVSILMLSMPAEAPEWVAPKTSLIFKHLNDDFVPFPLNQVMANHFSHFSLANKTPSSPLSAPQASPRTPGPVGGENNNTPNASLRRTLSDEAMTMTPVEIAHEFYVGSSKAPFSPLLLPEMSPVPLPPEGPSGKGWNPLTSTIEEGSQGSPTANGARSPGDNANILQMFPSPGTPDPIPLRPVNPYEPVTPNPPSQINLTAVSRIDVIGSPSSAHIPISPVLLANNNSAADKSLFHTTSTPSPDPMLPSPKTPDPIPLHPMNPHKPATPNPPLQTDPTVVIDVIGASSLLPPPISPVPVGNNNSTSDEDPLTKKTHSSPALQVRRLSSHSTHKTPKSLLPRRKQDFGLRHLCAARSARPTDILDPTPLPNEGRQASILLTKTIPPGMIEPFDPAG